MEFRTRMPPGFEESLQDLSDAEWAAAIDNFPDYYKFSPKRVIFHEASHALQDGSGLRYELNRPAYELPVINATNEFMYRHFGEPYRRSYHEMRPIQ